MFGYLFAADYESRLVILISEVVIIVAIFVLYLLINRLKHGNVPDVGDQGYEIDGIKEKGNSVPAVMHFLMLGFVSFGLWYVFVGFPVESWSQGKQYYNDEAEFNRRFAETWNRVGDPELLTMGRSLYSVHCTACHGQNGEGLEGMSANLVNFGKVEGVLHTIRHGSKGMGKLTPAMPPQWELLGPDDATRERKGLDVAAHVVTLAGGAPDKGDAAAGKEVYAAHCAVCHGPDGHGGGPGGNIPNFAADLTKYGHPSNVEEIARKGKIGNIGIMPAFNDFGHLTDLEFKAVALYVSKELN